MTEADKERIETIYNDIMKKPNRIYEIFLDFFGEEFVDMQGCLSLEDVLSIFEDAPLPDSNIRLKGMITGSRINPFILVHFPEVRVENEYDNFTIVHHLYVKVEFDTEGRGKGYFTMNRSDYQYTHLVSDYMHSHVPGLNLDNLSEFRSVCTGRGPINSTLATLAINFDDAMWQLLCLELSRYVQVESIAGVPYRRITNIGIPTGNAIPISTNFGPNSFGYHNISPITRNDILQNFVKYLLNKKILKFNYTDGIYNIAMSDKERTLVISRTFIEFYNSGYRGIPYAMNLPQLLDKGILTKCKLSQSKFIRLTGRGIDPSRFRALEGDEMFTFRGEPVRFHLIDNVPTEDEEENFIYILSIYIMNKIIKGILTVLNGGYGRPNRESSSIGVGERVRYI